MSLLQQLWSALDEPSAAALDVAITGAGELPSIFAVTDLAAASVGVAGLAAAELIAMRHGAFPKVRIDRQLASRWFGLSIRPDGWALPPIWDAIAGDYPTADGWIKLHTNAPAHRAAALAVLGVSAGKDAVARAVAEWKKDDLEAAIAGQGGCAAAMRSMTEWQTHPQGRAVAAEPLLHIAPAATAPPPAWPLLRERPLAGVRVLDLTRVLAGPVATRFLAGLGAGVLRIDPPWWEEPAVAPEVTLGKRCARLDLRDAASRSRFGDLLARADVLVHGYRPEALARLGFDTGRRSALRPGLVDVALDAYGWTGPWAARRGFDSLVQMSTGIADAGMRSTGRDRPIPLPVQALDHATGYLLAAAALRGLTQRLTTGQGVEVRTSLARVAAVLMSYPADPTAAPLPPETSADLGGGIEQTAWGPAQRLRPPVSIAGAPLHWDRPATALGSAAPVW